MGIFFVRAQQIYDLWHRCGKSLGGDKSVKICGNISNNNIVWKQSGPVVASTLCSQCPFPWRDLWSATYMAPSHPSVARQMPLRHSAAHSILYGSQSLPPGSQRWGADYTTLRRLYTSLILSKLDYGSFLYASAAPSLLLHLDRVQYAACRIILGALRCTPVYKLEAEADLMPLATRRRQLLSLYGNYGCRVLSIPSHPALSRIFYLLLTAFQPWVDLLMNLHFFTWPLLAFPPLLCFYVIGPLHCLFFPLWLALIKTHFLRPNGSPSFTILLPLFVPNSCFHWWI